jgi:hypothetical protein
MASSYLYLKKVKSGNCGLFTGWLNSIAQIFIEMGYVKALTSIWGTADGLFSTQLSAAAVSWP